MLFFSLTLSISNKYSLYFFPTTQNQFVPYVTVLFVERHQCDKSSACGWFPTVCNSIVEYKEMMKLRKFLKWTWDLKRERETAIWILVLKKTAASNFSQIAVHILSNCLRCFLNWCFVFSGSSRLKTEFCVSVFYYNQQTTEVRSDSSMSCLCHILQTSV